MKKSLAILTALCFLLLCGCDYKEIDRGYLVTAIGVEEKDGTTSICIEALSSSDVSEEKSGRITLLGNGDNVNDAYKNLKSTLVKPLYFEQVGTVIFGGSVIPNTTFLKNFSNINMGVYLVKTDDVNLLFEAESPNGVLGYDIINLTKTMQKENGLKLKNQLYQLQSENFVLPTVNISDGNLILKQEK